MKCLPVLPCKQRPDIIFCFVSDEDYDRCVSRTWWYAPDGDGFYVRSKANKDEIKEGLPQFIKLHRFILNVHIRRATKFEVVRHLDGNTLNNTRENLKLGTTHQNAREKINNNKNCLGLWGATFDKSIHRVRPWKAAFRLSGKQYNISYHLTEIEAHEAASHKYLELTGTYPTIAL